MDVLPDEIERIASYLISEKHLHTFVKCNPTILGYETARRTLDAMGYDYIVFDEHHFNEDLQWADAVPMFQRLQKLADSCGLEFGLKLSNTFPVDTTRGELPNNEMYMSGRSLFPLTIEMCHRISRQFGGRMRISFAGGAEYFNCDKLFAAGIWPITVATTILKPGGYNRLLQMVEKVEALPYRPFSGTDTQAICDLSTASHTDFHHVKPIKPPAQPQERQAGALAGLLHGSLQGRLSHRAGYPRICGAGPQGPVRPGPEAHHREEPPALPHRHHLRPPVPDQVLPEFLRRVRPYPGHQAGGGGAWL